MNELKLVVQGIFLDSLFLFIDLFVYIYARKHRIFIV